MKKFKELKENLKKACWKGYEAIGTKTKNGKEVPNCVPVKENEEYCDACDRLKKDCICDEQIKEDWQKVNKADNTDGMSQKAVNAYRRENPGSKLQTAVTEKNPSGKRASRRKSFCARMSGMKSAHASAETKRDPDSPINKALRRWRC